MKRIILALAVIGLFGPAAFAKDIHFVFADAAEGRKILTARDDYVQGLSPFDRAAKLKADKEVSEEEFLKFAGAQVETWSDVDKAILQPILDDLGPRLNALGLDWPDPVVLVRTTGLEEADAAYTRANAIFLPPSQLRKTALRELIAHELFHVFSRHNIALRTKLYAAIGYQPCGAVPFPSRLAALRINNPDATQNDYCIRVGVGGRQAWVTPIMFARSKYDAAKGGTFFDYLELKFLKVDGDGDRAPNPARYDDSKVQLLDVPQMQGFIEQIGRNTGYIIHPEETVADNFAILLLGKEPVPSPEVVQRLRDVLVQAKR